MEGASAGHMLNALWNATLGYTLRFFWNPIDSGQTLIEDSAIEQLRAFGVRFVRPGGPLSALRVGKTPYGMLPVCARSYQPKANSPIERELFEAIGWFRTHWELALATVPTLRDPKAESLHQVLAMQPWALTKRFWQVAGPAAAKNYPDIEPFAAWQGLFATLLIQSLLGKQPFSTQAPFLATCAVRPKPHSLDAVPWVQRDPEQPKQEIPDDRPLTPNYIATLQQLLTQPTNQIRAAITAMQNADSLLAAMLAFAADEEVLQSGRGLVLKHVIERTNLSMAMKTEAKRLRPAEYIGVDVATPMGDQFDLGHANAVLGLKLQGTIGNAESVEQFIGSHFGQAVINWPEQLQQHCEIRRQPCLSQGSNRRRTAVRHSGRRSICTRIGWMRGSHHSPPSASTRCARARPKACTSAHSAWSKICCLIRCGPPTSRPTASGTCMRRRCSRPRQRRFCAARTSQTARRPQAPSISICAPIGSSVPAGSSKGSQMGSRWLHCSVTASSEPCATPRCHSTSSNCGAHFR